MPVLTFIVGIVLGGFAAILAVSATLNEPIDACKREHNVYECKLQAVPVAAPTWVQK